MTQAVGRSASLEICRFVDADNPGASIIDGGESISEGGGGVGEG